MNKITDKELKKYYAEISKAILCDKKQKTAFLAELKSNVGEYLSAEEDAKIENVISAFGTPEEIAKSFMENSSPALMKKKLDIKKYILIFLAMALLIYLVFVIVSLIDVHTEAHGYLDEGIMMINNLKGGELL